MIDRTYPSSWGAAFKYRTIEECRKMTVFAKVHEEVLRRFFALADFCYDNGKELGPGGGWRPLSQQLPLSQQYHLRDDVPGFAEACATRNRPGGCCWYEGHFYIHRVDGPYLKSIHKALPPSWHMGVPLPEQPADTMKDLDKYPCTAIDARGEALRLRSDGGCFAGDHAARFGLWWVGKADAPHFQAAEVRGKIDPRTGAKMMNSGGRNQIRPFAGWPLQKIQLPEGYNDPFNSTKEDPDVAKLVQINGDLAQFAVNGMEARWIEDPTKLRAAQWLGTVTPKPVVWEKAFLQHFILNGPEPVESGVSTISAADFAGHNPDAQ